MELIAILFVIAIWDVSKSAARNARQDYRREAGPKPKAKSGKGPGRDPDATARAHRARGWWLRELGSGFAVTRTGWHAGWLAHNAEADRARLEREEARTLHAEGRTGVQRHVAAFRQRHAEATRALEEQLEKQRQAGDQATGKSAVQSAADEVERKRKEREQSAGPRCPGCGAPEGYDHLPGCDPSVPPLPASGVRTAADYPRSTMFPGMHPREAASPEVIDTPVRVHNAEDSAHLRPGEPRCEGCGGTGRNGDGTDACPVCRGWGSASVGPEFMAAAPAGTVCNACGRKGTPADPVLIAPGGTTIHTSHAAEQHEAYADALKRQYPDDGEIDDAVMEADSGPIPFDPPTTQGAPVSDTSYKSALANAKAFAAECDQAAAEAKTRRTRAEQDVEGMQALDVDSNTTGSAMDMLDELTAAEKATQSASDHAAAYADGLQKRHGGIDAAVDDAPIPQAAHRDFYGQG